MRFDQEDRLKLDCPGTTRALARHKIVLKDGLRLLVYGEDLDDDQLIDDLVAVGVVRAVNGDEWVAEVEGGEFRHVSELNQDEQRAYRRFRPQVGSPLA